MNITRLKEQLDKLFAGYPNAKINNDTYDAYYDALKDIADRKVEGAIATARLTCKFVPSAAELVELAGGAPMKLGTQAQVVNGTLRVGELLQAEYERTVREIEQREARGGGHKRTQHIPATQQQRGNIKIDLVDDANRWALGCDRCEFGVVSRPEYGQIAAPLYVEQAWQYKNGQVVLCDCRAGQSRKRRFEAQLRGEATDFSEWRIKI